MSFHLIDYNVCCDLLSIIESIRSPPLLCLPCCARLALSLRRVLPVRGRPEGKIKYYFFLF